MVDREVMVSNPDTEEDNSLVMEDNSKWDNQVGTVTLESKWDNQVVTVSLEVMVSNSLVDNMVNNKIPTVEEDMGNSKATEWEIHTASNRDMATHMASNRATDNNKWVVMAAKGNHKVHKVIIIQVHTTARLHHQCHTAQQNNKIHHQTSRHENYLWVPLAR